MASETTNGLNLILPGNPRYQPRELKETFGYDRLYRTIGEVELALLWVLADLGFIPAGEIAELTPLVEEKILEILTTRVDEIEKITRHDIRAWVAEARSIINGKLGRLIHVVYTSYDPISTGRILQYQRAYQHAIKPAIKEVCQLMAELVVRFADQVQIGRTHGQHALPITVGFWLATILSRMLYNAGKMEIHNQELVGKISGAVGAHNAQFGLGLADRCGNVSFEERVLARLGLKPARISTQILPPEPLAYFLYSCCMLSAAIGQFGRDCRHLMRSEIAEVAEEFSAEQSGSSTMGHKRNPITFENLEGTWIKTKNEYGKVMDTLISEHQRDLVGSPVERDFPIILVNLMQQLNALRKRDKATNRSFLRRMTIDRAACERNFKMNANVILSEPIYIALQMAGYLGDAHKLVNHTLVPIAKKENIPLAAALMDMAERDVEVWKAVSLIPEEMRELFWHPERYIGDAREKALQIASLVDKQFAKAA